ncbi:hypothetical protein QBC39DRAFT_432012 [Podospora conica]|nr:hypothetical protein QBC39DRAFT_432012 [Schizothecium conicum]
MPIPIDTKSVTAMTVKFDDALPLLLAAIKDNKEGLPFEVLAGIHIDALLRAGPARYGQPAQYHVPNMTILTNSLAIAMQAAKDMVSFGAGGEEVKHLGDVCGRLVAYIDDKIDQEMNKRYSQLTAATPTSSTWTTGGQSICTPSSIAASTTAEKAIPITDIASGFAKATESTNVISTSAGAVTDFEVVSMNTPSVSAGTDFEIVDGDDAATTSTVNELEGWDLV